MTNGDTHEYNDTDYERMNEFRIQRMVPAMQDFSIWYQITERESEILILIAFYGYSNREIAEHCVISEKTVKNHMANIMKKLGIGSTRRLISLLFKYVLSRETQDKQLEFYDNYHSSGVI
jgi:DNA-binding NarL/FixJ family response regulator